MADIRLDELRMQFEESLKSSKSDSTIRSFMSYWKKVKSHEDTSQKYIVCGYTRKTLLICFPAWPQGATGFSRTMSTLLKHL